MKFLLVVGILYGAWWYVSKHYEFHDTLEYAKKHPESTWAEPADYYVGLVYYQRADYPKAQEAFAQLLTQYPTGSYESNGLFYLEDAAESNRDWEAANTAAKQYVDDFPNGKYIEVMRKRIELLHYQHGTQN
jgi:outer membrane protein assembly factor BamD (BamD/ComL family)